jgi:hypothetical protein
MHGTGWVTETVDLIYYGASTDDESAGTSH